MPPHPLGDVDTENDYGQLVDMTLLPLIDSVTIIPVMLSDFKQPTAGAARATRPALIANQETAEYRNECAGQQTQQHPWPSDHRSRYHRGSAV